MGGDCTERGPVLRMCRARAEHVERKKILMAKGLSGGGNIPSRERSQIGGEK